MERSAHLGRSDRVLKCVFGGLTLVCSLGTVGKTPPVKYYEHDYGNANWISGTTKVVTWLGSAMRYGDNLGFTNTIYREKGGAPDEIEAPFPILGAARSNGDILALCWDQTVPAAPEIIAYRIVRDPETEEWNPTELARSSYYPRQGFFFNPDATKAICVVREGADTTYQDGQLLEFDVATETFNFLGGASGTRTFEYSNVWRNAGYDLSPPEYPNDPALCNGDPDARAQVGTSSSENETEVCLAADYLPTGERIELRMQTAGESSSDAYITIDVGNTNAASAELATIALVIEGDGLSPFPPGLFPLALDFSAEQHLTRADYSYSLERVNLRFIGLDLRYGILIHLASNYTRTDVQTHLDTGGNHVCDVTETDIRRLMFNGTEVLSETVEDEYVSIVENRFPEARSETGYWHGCDWIDEGEGTAFHLSQNFDPKQNVGPPPGETFVGHAYPGRLAVIMKDEEEGPEWLYSFRLDNPDVGLPSTWFHTELSYGDYVDWEIPDNFPLFEIGAIVR